MSVSNKRMKSSAVPTASLASPDATRNALMDAAERLFAENGLEGASVRDITKAAKANLGSVNYHFGTKDGLIMAVFSRRLKPLNGRRLALLDAVEAATPAGQPLPVEGVLDAFLRPMVDQQADDMENSQAFVRLLCRCFQERNPQLESLIYDQFGDIVRRINAALLRALPALPADEVYWRVSFLFGSAHHALDNWTRFDSNPFASMPGAPVPRRLDRGELLERLIAYAAAGLRGTAGVFP